MNQVAYKCYLGLALEQTINQLGLQSIKDKIFQIYYDSFNEKFEELKNTQAQQAKGSGNIVQHYQYPIGQGGKLQYFQAYGQLNFSSTKTNILRSGPQNSMIECFSNNNDPRTKRNKSKVKGPREAPSKRKKLN